MRLNFLVISFGRHFRAAFKTVSLTYTLGAVFMMIYSLNKLNIDFRCVVGYMNLCTFLSLYILPCGPKVVIELIQSKMVQKGKKRCILFEGNHQ